MLLMLPLHLISSASLLSSSDSLGGVDVNIYCDCDKSLADTFSEKTFPGEQDSFVSNNNLDEHKCGEKEFVFGSEASSALAELVVAFSLVGDGSNSSRCLQGQTAAPTTGAVFSVLFVVCKAGKFESEGTATAGTVPQEGGVLTDAVVLEIGDVLLLLVEGEPFPIPFSSLLILAMSA